MSRKIIGVTVGTQLPKPNFKQTDPTKGDYIKNKPDFDGLKSKVDTKADLVDGKVPVEQLPTNVSVFNNDVGYLTSVPDEYVTATELNNAIESFDTAISEVIGSGVLS